MDAVVFLQETLPVVIIKIVFEYAENSNIKFILQSSPLNPYPKPCVLYDGRFIYTLQHIETKECVQLTRYEKTAMGRIESKQIQGVKLFPIKHSPPIHIDSHWIAAPNSNQLLLNAFWCLYVFNVSTHTLIKIHNFICHSRYTSIFNASGTLCLIYNPNKYVESNKFIYVLCMTHPERGCIRFTCDWTHESSADTRGTQVQWVGENIFSIEHKSRYPQQPPRGLQFWEMVGTTIFPTTATTISREDGISNERSLVTLAREDGVLKITSLRNNRTTHFNLAESIIGPRHVWNIQMLHDGAILLKSTSIQSIPQYYQWHYINNKSDLEILYRNRSETQVKIVEGNKLRSIFGI